MVKPHLADLSLFWRDLGVTFEEQREAAPWAFEQPPVVKTPAGCATLPEDRLTAYNPLSTPVTRDKPRRQYRQIDPAMFERAVAALAEFATLPN